MARSPKPPQPTESRKALAKKRIKAHYDTYMPNKKHHRVLIWVVFLVCSTVVALQLLYPPERALPLARITGESVAWQSHEQLAKTLDVKFRKTKLTLTIGNDKSTEVILAKAGAEPNTEQMIEEVSSYPFWQRFIPFSILLNVRNLTVADVYFTDSVLKAFAAEQAGVLSFEPVNARLAIENGALTATAEKHGSAVTPTQVRDSIANATSLLG